MTVTASTPASLPPYPPRFNPGTSSPPSSYIVIAVHAAALFRLLRHWVALFLIEQGLGTVSESVCTNRHSLSFCINVHFQFEYTLGTGTVLAIGTCHGHWRTASARI